MRTFRKSFYTMCILLLFILCGTIVSMAQEVYVSSPQEFYNAWNNSSTTKIILNNDISYEGRGLSDLNKSTRTTDIEITSKDTNNGYGYRLDLKKNALQVRRPTTSSGRAVFYLHHITLENTGSVTGSEAAAVNDELLDGVQARQWTFELENIRVPGGWREYTPKYEFDKNGNKVTYSDTQRKAFFAGLSPSEQAKYGSGETHRLVKASRAQINVRGQMSVYTKSENYYTGGLYLHEGTDYDGAITDSNFSAIWFQARSEPGDTGTGNLELAQNSKMRIRNTGDGSTYPAIFKSFQNILIGENAEFIATVPGNAIQFVGKDKSFVAKKGSKVILNSMDGLSSIKTGGVTAGSEGGTTTRATNTKIRFEPGSSLFIIGDADKNGMIDMTPGENNTFIIDTPEQFDIRNTQYNSKGKNNEFKAVDMSESNTFQVLNSNIDMWHVDTPVNDMSDYAYPNVKDAKIFVTGKGSRAKYGANSSDAKLVTEYTASEGNIRRITGLNTKPSVEWQYIPTDADKQFKNVARMVLGEVPDDKGLDNNGQLSFEKVYARAGQGTIKINDSTNKYPEKTKTTLNDGYIQLDNDDFYKAGTILSGQAFRIGLTGEVQQSPEVIDITPPDIAQLDQEFITMSSKKITGKNAEPNTVMKVTLNGVDYGGVVPISDNGNWEFNFSDYLKATDIVKVYMEDLSGKAPDYVEDPYDLPKPGKDKRLILFEPAAPPTNSNRGNINPTSDLKYRDALFKAATELKVKDNIPSKPIVEKKVTSDTFSDKEMMKPITQVGTNLTYSIHVHNQDDKESLKVLLDTKIEDEIPLGLLLDDKSVSVQRNGKEVQDKSLITYKEYSKEEQEQKKKQGKLIFDVGDFEPQEKVTVTFSVKVLRDAVGKVVTNTSLVKGYSPQLQDFNNPNSGLREVVNEASVDNPGGEVSGQLLLVSAPTKFNFGEVKLTDFYKEQVLDLTSTENKVHPLVVEDTRGAKSNWRLTATLLQEMSYFQANDTQPTDTLKDSLSFTYDKQNEKMKLNTPLVIYDSKNHEVKDEYNISKEFWQQNKEDMTKSDGLKMTSKKVPMAQEYQGKIEWILEDVQP